MAFPTVTNSTTTAWHFSTTRWLPDVGVGLCELLKHYSFRVYMSMYNISIDILCMYTYTDMYTVYKYTLYTYIICNYTSSIHIYICTYTCVYIYLYMAVSCMFISLSTYGPAYAVCRIFCAFRVATTKHWSLFMGIFVLCITLSNTIKSP